MTWTEGAFQISDTITIYGGYWGIISFIVFVLSMVAIIGFISLALGTSLSSTLKELKD